MKRLVSSADDNWAFEFEPIYDYAQPTSTETSSPSITSSLQPQETTAPTSTETAPSVSQPQPTPTETRGIADPLIYRDYTPTWTDDIRRFLGVEIETEDNNVTIRLRTNGKYSHWRYEIDGIATAVYGGEVTTNVFDDGNYDIRLWIADVYGNRVYGTDYIDETFSVPGGYGFKTHVIKHCWDGRFLAVEHQRDINRYSFFEIDDGKYEGCWTFTPLSITDVALSEPTILNWSHVKVFYPQGARTADGSCECCTRNTCDTSEIKHQPPPWTYTPWTPTFTPETPTPQTPTFTPETPTPQITPSHTEDLSQDFCDAALIVKNQGTKVCATPTGTESVSCVTIWEDNTLFVKEVPLTSTITDNQSELIVKGCPKGAEAEGKKYYVWIKRSDSCSEEWMNGGSPFVFEYISEDQCNCPPYLQIEGNSFVKNKSTSIGEDEVIKSLSLQANGDAVYIVHMLISEDSNPSNAGRKGIDFFENYTDQSKEEVFLDLTIEDDTENITKTSNIYLSPSDENGDYFGANHVIEVGKSISKINRIYFSEDTPF
jgi:hypothetical protein